VHARLVPAAVVAMRDPSMPRPAGAAAASYSGPPLLRLEASWSARSEAAGRVRTREITNGYWPASQLGATAPVAGDDAAFVMVVRSAWRPMVELALDVYGATLPGQASEGFAIDRRNWRSAHGAALGSLVGGLEPWLEVWCPTGADTSPRAELGWQVRLRKDASAETAAGLLEELTAGLRDRVPDARWAGLGVSWSVDGAATARVHGRVRIQPPETK
jgi:hypothetical protein